MNQFRLFPEQASSFASRVDGLFFYLLGVTGFFSILIATLIVYFALKYRRIGQGSLPQAESGGLWLEITWTVIPLGIVMSMFVWASRLYFSAHRSPSDAMEIYVIGKQWMWKVQHPQGRREINELHLPLGRSVKLIMTSQDVIHDFYIPAFRMKQDVLPGRYTYEWFQPTKLGEFHLFCAQYCGTQHANMIGRVIVMEPSQYQAWLAGVPPDAGMREAGEKLFEQYACNTCHGTKAPTLAGLFGSQVRLQDGQMVTADENYLRQSILNPGIQIVSGYQNIMPSFRGQLNEEQLQQLIAYIKSLRSYKQNGDGGK